MDDYYEKKYTPRLWSIASRVVVLLCTIVVVIVVISLLFHCIFNLIHLFGYLIRKCVIKSVFRVRPTSTTSTCTSKFLTSKPATTSSKLRLICLSTSKYTTMLPRTTYNEQMHQNVTATGLISCKRCEIRTLLNRYDIKGLWSLFTISFLGF